MDKDKIDMKLALDDLDEVSGGLEMERDNVSYTVQEGDSLHSIAEKYGVSTEILFVTNMPAIIKAANEHGHTYLNPVDYAHALFPGTVLNVPHPKK